MMLLRYFRHYEARCQLMFIDSEPLIVYADVAAVDTPPC